MRPLFRSLLVVGLLTAGTAVAAVAGATIASADTKICEPSGSTVVGGKYVVMNNRWGGTAEQCINVTDSGFSITSQQSVNDPSSYPVSFPNIYVGCYYKACTPGTNLPAKISSISSATSDISYTFVSGATYDAIYDVWLDPAANKDTMNQTELRIWFNRTGSVQPVGYTVGNAIINNRSWDVWKGDTGQHKVISFVSPSPLSSLSFSLMDFINEAIRREFATKDWYLTSVQAGFEPWSGGTGLAVTSFSADIQGGEVSLPPILPPSSIASSSTPVPPSSSAPVSSSSKPVSPSSSRSRSSSSSKPVEPSGPVSCAVSYDAQGWEDGYSASVDVYNNGDAAINNWTLTYNLPDSQKIDSAWNAKVTQANGKVTATGVDWNTSIAAGENVSFGYQVVYGEGDTDTWPSNFRLNGTLCTEL